MPTAVVLGVLFGNRDGTFDERLYSILGWPPERVPFDYDAVTLGDFNGDDRIDLAFGVIPLSEKPAGVVIIPQGCDGFGEPLFLEGSWGLKPFRVNLNKDSQDELVLAFPYENMCFLTWREP